MGESAKWTYVVAVEWLRSKGSLASDEKVAGTVRSVGDGASASVLGIKVELSVGNSCRSCQ